MKNILTSWGTNKDDKKEKTRSRRRLERLEVRYGAENLSTAKSMAKN
jgi:hypothetical protein